jgi:hypothetical protein
MRPYMNYTDDEIVTAITETYAARRKIAAGGLAVVIAGEGRRVEYTQGSASLLAEDLRMLEYEARQRGLEIAGQGGAISVEFR